MVRKRKTFHRCKVSNRGYVSGKRQQMFRAHEKKRKAPASAAITDGDGDRNIETAVSVSHNTRETEDLQG